jgi:uncharacterized coiled-coil protein SlyX
MSNFKQTLIDWGVIKAAAIERKLEDGSIIEFDKLEIGGIPMFITPDGKLPVADGEYVVLPTTETANDGFKVSVKGGLIESIEMEKPEIEEPEVIEPVAPAEVEAPVQEEMVAPEAPVEEPTTEAPATDTKALEERIGMLEQKIANLEALLGEQLSAEDDDIKTINQKFEDVSTILSKVNKTYKSLNERLEKIEKSPATQPAVLSAEDKKVKREIITKDVEDIDYWVEMNKRLQKSEKIKK